ALIGSDSCRCQRGGATVFGVGHLLGRDVEIAVVVEGVADRDDEQRDEAEDGEPPHVPDHRHADHHRQAGEDHAGAGVARHVDGAIAVQRAGVAALLHVVPGVQVVDDGREREVIGRRRRRGRPFQRAPAPGIAGEVAELVAVLDADEQLHQEGTDAG
nr:hypothetical protein [Tanacetum cinerariifolium]